jgi:Skp family chaperone for outer membrane proteins
METLCVRDGVSTENKCLDLDSAIRETSEWLIENIPNKNKWEELSNQAKKQHDDEFEEMVKEWDKRKAEKEKESNG